jgi:hypothetical protein
MMILYLEQMRSIFIQFLTMINSAINLSMFMLSLSFVILVVCLLPFDWSRICACCLLFVYICIVVGDPVIKTERLVSLIFLLFPHFTTDCEKIVLLTSEFNCSQHLIGQFLFCRDYFLSNCDRSFYRILKDIVDLNTIFM